MKKSFANLNAPVLAGVIRERTPKKAIAAIRNAEMHGATAIDLHLSCLDDQYKNVRSISEIVATTNKPILALNYNQRYDGSLYNATEQERIDLLMMAAEAGVSAIDLQGYTLDLPSKHAYTGNADYSFTKGNPKEIVTDEGIIQQQMELIDRIHAMGIEVLLSTHTSIPMNCEQMVDLAKYLEKRNPDILKFVTICNTEEEMLEAFKTMLVLKKEIKNAKVHFHCGGEFGKWTRLINPLLGSYLIFCVDQYCEGSTMGQLHLQTTSNVIEGIKRLMQED